jgi:mannitol-1-phosphate/altronate dehydrogenase
MKIRLKTLNACIGRSARANFENFGAGNFHRAHCAGLPSQYSAPPPIGDY